MSILTKLDAKDFEKILSYYSIGKYKSHKHVSWALGNTIYFIKTDAGKFVLKVFENSDPNFIAYQLKLYDIVIKNKLPVPRTILTKTKQRLLFFNKKRIIIQEFIDGHHPKKLSAKLIIDIARNQSKMNKAFLKLKLKNKYNWGGDYHFRLMSFNVKKFDDFDIRKEEKDTLKELRKINKTKLRRSSVHGDFHSVNLLVKKNKLKAILDWDDAHEDYLIHDLVCFMAHSFIKIKNIYRKQIKLYLKEYQKTLKLNPEEKKAVYFFIKQRYLAAISWQIKQIKKHKDIRNIIERNIRKDIKKYKNFSKSAVETFLNSF